MVSQTDVGEAGSVPRLEFSLPYDPARLLRARVRLREYLSHLTTEEHTVDEVILAIMEAATNALRHSGGSGSFDIRLSVEDDELVAVVRDDGQGFDPSGFHRDETPDPLSIGGRGLFLMTRLMDAVDFSFDGGCQVLMRKRLALAPGFTPLGFARAASPERMHDGLNERLIEMLEDGDEAFTALDWEFRYLYVNRASERLARHSRQEVIGRCVFDVFPTMKESVYERNYRLAMEEGVVAYFEARFEPYGAWDELRVYPAPFGIAIYFRDITERKRVEAEHRELLSAVERQRAQLGAVLEHLNEGVVVVDAEAKVLQANAAARRMGGFDRERVSRVPDMWSEFELLTLSGRRLAAHELPGERVARGERFSGLELTVRNQESGRELLVSFDGVPVRDEQGQVALGLLAIHDISDRKREEAREALHGAVVRGVTEILEAALACTDEEALGRVCLRVAEGVTQSEFGFIDEIVEGDRLAGIAMSDAGYGACSVGEHPGFVEGKASDKAALIRGLHGEVVRCGEAFYTNDPATHPASEGLPAGHVPLHAFLGAPLKRGAETIGVVAVGNRAGGYGDDQRWALESLASVIVQAIDRLRARAALQESLARTRVLARIAAAAAGADSAEQVSEAVLVAAALHLGLKAGSVNCLDEVHGELQRCATFGAAYGDDPSLRLAIPMDDTFNVGRMLSGGLPYMTHESPGQSEASRARFAGMGFAGDSWVKVPIKTSERVLGAMTLVFPGKRAFHRDDIAFYGAVADQLGVALQRARLADERETQRRLLQRTAHLSLTLDVVNDAVRGVVEPLSALAQGAHLAAAALGARLSSLHLLSDGTWQELRRENDAILSRPCAAEEVPLGDLVREVMRPVAFCRLPGAAALLSEGAPRSECLLGAPLASGGEMLGAVFFASEEAREYTQAELDFARKVGVALGGALQNRQLYVALNEQLELSHLLLRASKVLTQWTDLAAMLERLTDVLLLSAPGSRVGVVLVHPERHHAELAASKGIAPLEKGEYLPEVLLAGRGDLIRAPRTVVAEYDGDLGMSRAKTGFPRHRLFVPVMSRGRLMGFLTVEAPESRQGFTPGEVRTVEAIADQAATAIENARLYDAEVEAQRRAARELETSQLLLTTASAFSSETDPRQLLNVVTETLMRRFDEARVSITLRHDDVETIVATSGGHAYPVGTVFRREEYSKPALEAMETGRAVAIDYEVLPPEERGTSCQYGMCNSIVAPLVTRGRTIGILVIDQANARTVFTERDVRLAQAIADQAAVAIDNAMMLDKEREDARFGEALDEAGKLLHSSLDDDTILAGALQSGARALLAISGVIAVIERGRWVAKCQVGFSPDVVGRSWPDETVPFMAQVRRQRGPAIMRDAQGGDRHLAGSATPPSVGSTLAIPLTVGEEVVGVLVYNKAEIDAFSEAEVTFAGRLARSVSLALQNARLFANEHTIAETLQEALLAMPEAVPGFTIAHTYHSATVAARVGGDFYDVFEIADDVVGVVVGDISGKGLDAAVFTSVVKNAIRAQAMDEGKSPADVLRVVNEVLLRSSAPEIFASVFFAIIENGHVVYCNAGHTPALLLHHDLSLEWLPHTSPVVGAFPDMPFVCAEARIEPGELLFLYTDGLVEARVDGVLFGEHGLLALFAEPGMNDAASAVNRVSAAVVEFAEGRLSDDLALLAITPDGASGFTR